MGIVAALVMVVTWVVAPASNSSAATRATSSGAQSASSLIAADALGTALGSPVVSTTSLGGAASGTGSYDSEATATTATGAVLTFVVSTFPSAKSAKQAYGNLIESISGSTPLSGVGDQAVTAPNDTYVLKGAQVLTVSAKPTTEKELALSQVKASGGDPEAAFAAIQQTAPTAAKVLAAKLSGSGSRSSGYVAPPGGVNPCLLSGAQVAKLYGASSASGMPVLSESPPATECRYTISGVGAEDLLITTSDQLYNLSYPTDILAEYATLGGQVNGASSLSPSTSAALSAYQAPRSGAVLVDSIGSGRLGSSSEVFKSKPCDNPKIVQAQDDGSLEISTDKAGKARVQLVKQAAQALPPKQPNQAYKATVGPDGNVTFTPTSAPPNYDNIESDIHQLVDNLNNPDGTISKTAADELLKELDTLKKGIRDHCEK